MSTTINIHVAKTHRSRPQGMVERLPIVTGDQLLHLYDIETTW